jgi:hypothetical protein
VNPYQFIEIQNKFSVFITVAASHELHHGV